jgi:hypothetical protein
MKARQLVAIAAVLTVGLTACGGGGKKSSSLTSASSATTAAPTVSTVKATSGGQFCQLLAASFNSTASATTPGQLKTGLQNAITKGDQALPLAPSDIKADLTVLFNAVKTLYGDLVAVNFDESKLDPTKLQALTAPPLPAASTHLDQWAQQHCGITLPANGV